MPPRLPRAAPAATALLALLFARAAGTPPAVHWAYRPLVKPPVPAVKHTDRVRNPVDAFVLAKLEARGMTLSPPADRRTLLRRIAFDLTGLPPTPEEVDAFLADPSPDAYEKVVDRLLASPRYGERLARHWMDVIHFAETHGNDQDAPRENAWPYREYLIRAFNDDKSYPRFVGEQLAGDVLYPDDPQATVATGFLAAGPWDESSQKDIRDDTLDKKVSQNLDRDDMVTTAMATFVSATVHCARCHDHKFDPVPQADYYSLQAVFAGVDRADRPYDPDPAVAKARRELTVRQRRLEAGGTALAALVPRPVLLRGVAAELAALPPEKLVYAAASDFKPAGSFKPAKGCRPVFVLKRGDVNAPREPAGPGALACVPGLPSRFALANPGDEGARRAALAKWVADPRNVLTWRSVVNRVWHYHFGRGIVATPNDLGRMGAAPTHPELLDWLACEFRDGGGSLKGLHRLLVTSAVYTQSSKTDPDRAKRDADNLLLWRMNRTRLDAESLRDAVLRVSGKLDLTTGGPSVKHFLQTKGVHVTPNVDYRGYDPDGPGAYRRSVYRFLFRTLPDPFMDALDCPDASQFAPTRASSVTALQALALLNDRFMVRQCEHFAARVAPADGIGTQVREAYRLALGRPPSEQESAAMAAYATRHGMANACRLLLNSNEFLFVP